MSWTHTIAGELIYRLTWAVTMGLFLWHTLSRRDLVPRILKAHRAKNTLLCLLTMGTTLDVLRGHPGVLELAADAALIFMVWTMDDDDDDDEDKWDRIWSKAKSKLPRPTIIQLRPLGNPA